MSILTYLLTPWSRVLLEKLTSLQLVKKFPAFYGTRTFITAFTSARNPGPRRKFMFRDKASFYGEELSTPRPTPQLEDHPLSAVRDCVFSLFAATFHIGDRSSIRNLRKGHSVVTGTHLSRLQWIYFQEYNVFSDAIWIWKWRWRRTYMVVPRGINSGADGFFFLLFFWRVLKANGEY